MTNQAQIPHLTVYAQHTPSPRGGARSNWDQFKRTVTSLSTFRGISHWRLHFPLFCNRRTRVCHYNGSAFTHLYIKGTPRNPKVESLSLLNPHFWPLLTWASKCLQVHTLRPSRLKLTHFHHQQPPRWRVLTVTFWSGMIS